MSERQLYRAAQWINDFQEVWFTGSVQLPNGHDPYDSTASLRIFKLAHGLSLEDGREWAYMALGISGGVRSFTPYGALWNEQFAQGREHPRHMDLMRLTPTNMADIAIRQNVD